MTSSATIYGPNKTMACRAWDGVWYIYDAKGVYTGRSVETSVRMDVVVELRQAARA